MSKKLFLFSVSIVCLVFNAIAQEGIGIGTEDVNSDAILEIDSKTDGLLIPRMNTAQRNAVGASSEGLIVFDTNYDAFFYWDSSPGIWRKLVATESDLDVDLGVNSISASDYGLNATGNGPVPKGGIIMWSGAVNAIPTGWTLCNGSNGSPDLRNRFIVGAGSSYSPGNTGGSNAVTLTQSQMPSHNHEKGTLSTLTSGNHRHSTKINRLGLDHKGSATEIGPGQDQTDARVFYSSYEGNHTHTISGSTGSRGGGGSHENRPPYYALAYIMKL